MSESDALPGRTAEADGRRALVAAFSGNALDNFDLALFTFLIPSLSVLWAMNRAQAGLIATVTIVTGAIGGVLAGAAADRWGRSRILQLTIIAFAICTFLCGFAQGPGSLLVLRALQGFGFGGELAVGAVLVGEWVSPNRRGRTLGMVASGFSIGSLAAFGMFAAIASLFPPEQAWRVLFWIGLLPAGLALYVRRHVKDAPRSEAERAPRRWQIGRLFVAGRRLHTVLATLLVMGITGAQNCYVIWLPTLLQTERGFSVGVTGVNYIANSLGAIAGFLFGGIVSDRLGRRRGFAVTVVVALGSLTTFLFANIPGMLLAPLAGAVGFLIVAAGVAITSYLVELFSSDVRATGTGFCYSVGRGGGAVFPAAVGFISTRASLSLAIWAMVLVAYALVLTTVWLLPETHRQSAPLK